MDNREIDGTDETGASSDDKSSLLFDFNGQAILKGDRKYRNDLSLELIRELNSELSGITEKIKEDLKSKLPPGADLKVAVEFSRGSIEWAGVVIVMDWVSRLADNISFVEYVTKAIKFSINKVVRNQIELRAPVKYISTTVARRKGADPFHPVSRFLWWCSGAVKDIIQSSRTDHAKYEGVGGAVLTTGVLAFFSGSYAMYTLFEGAPYQIIMSMFLGVVWALAIFNLDRYIVASMRKESHGAGSLLRVFLRELVPAIPRLLLALVIGFTISKPLELRIFNGPIEERIGISRDEIVREKDAGVRRAYALRLADLDREIHQFDVSLQVSVARANYLEDEFHRETDSTGGSGKYGYSTVARLKEQAAHDARQEVASLRRNKNQLQSQKDAIEAEMHGRLAYFEKKLKDDFFIKMRALSELTKKYDSMRWADYFIILLLVLVEATPVLVKLLSPLGPYDIKLNMINDVESREAGRKRDAMNEIIAYHYERVVESERHAEDIFFRIRNDLRERRLNQIFTQWRSQSFSGQEPTFDDLEEFVRDNVFTTRKA